MAFENKVQQSSVENFLTLYELDLRKLGGEIYRFHGHNDGVITWQGEAYTPIAITSDGLEMRSDGRASTPKLSIGDKINGIQGAIGALCRMYDDFAGAKLIITHAIDDDYKQQIWFIEQKTAENPSSGVLEFELSNPVDFAGKKIPVRTITNFCHWAVMGEYRGEACGYTGTARFTIDGKPTDNPLLDKCGGCVSDCQLRFGQDNPLPFGGFPAAGLV
ncbi:tail protein [Moraxella phage Mcat10]|uniref:phage minor tail protein L n=1 Tax=Moraxella catarrhalis TaxID=480 RepID=UPI000720A52F|nr:phage minor tail protein L [Moraxella catarrhalis]AKI27462.1 tail protein [Moraxella phage Mcat10]AKI27495.1 tail protein [Moraxella phage Mcat11]AKI27532.1 tail protein [Moraxella phage Mcat12]MPW55316.1 phage minor tail protein L [Moraxella catarrhalis]MPW59258.1 phage minor tail protein L [Moraxella catarrhalis]